MYALRARAAHFFKWRDGSYKQEPQNKIKQKPNFFVPVEREASKTSLPARREYSIKIAKLQGGSLKFTINLNAKI